MWNFLIPIQYIPNDFFISNVVTMAEGILERRFFCIVYERWSWSFIIKYSKRGYHRGTTIVIEEWKPYYACLKDIVLWFIHTVNPSIKSLSILLSIPNLPGVYLILKQSSVCLILDFETENVEENAWRRLRWKCYTGIL